MKNVVITGSNGSIGTEIVKWFKKPKWKVFSWDPRRELFPVEKIDVLILAHGGHGKSVDDTYEKNALSVGRILQYVKRKLTENACIIVITSRRAVKPIESEWDYAASKAASHAYVKAIYKSNPNLRITAISPGWVESTMANNGNAKKVIPVKQLCELIYCCVNSDGMRIPEICMEPIGDSEF